MSAHRAFNACAYFAPHSSHGHGIPSYGAYYQEMLASHAKMEHDKYLEAREKVVTQSEQAQEELLAREAALAEKEAAYQQHLVEREAMLRKSQQEWRRTVTPYAAQEYPFRRTRFQQSRSPFQFEQTLLQKHRLESHIKAYEDELDQLETQRSRFDSELKTMVDSRVSQ